MSENAVQSRSLVSLLYLLFFFSGIAGLGYQMAWAKMFATGLGHEIPAVLAIVAAFMGGMALGAWALDSLISRSKRPGHWYGYLELIIGGWGLLSTILIPLANSAALQWIGIDPSTTRHWTVAFLIPLLVLLPATAAMGATLPAMDRFISPLSPLRQCIGGIYAANTFGAVGGILLSTFFFIPWLGLKETIWILAGINFVAAAGAFLLQKRTTGQTRVLDSGKRGAAISRKARGKSLRQTRPPPSAVNAPARGGGLSPWRISGSVFLTGLLGIGYEAVGVRVMAQVLENTVYTFAGILSVYLFGLAAGGALYQRYGRGFAPAKLLSGLLGAVSLACLAGGIVMSFAPGLYELCRNAWGDSRLAVLLAEVTTGGAVFLLPTMLMGAIFSLLVQNARREEGGVGQAAALNTFGGAWASALFAVWLLPRLGSKWTLVMICLAYLVLIPKVSRWSWGFIAGPLLLTVSVFPSLQLLPAPSNGKRLAYREGVMASVAVYEEPTGHRTLRVNNRFQMGGTGAVAAEYRQGHIPLLLHPAPERALFLGVGTGITFGAAAVHPNLLAEGVELVPEVAELLHWFEPHNFFPQKHPALRLHVADARRFVQATPERYDVIIADLFHPAMDGAGSLYTLEHFQAIRDKLTPDGLFCQWLPLHQLDLPMLRSITRTFLEVFPNTDAFLLRLNVDAPVLGLVGKQSFARYSPDWIERKAREPELGKELKSLALADSMRVFGLWLAGPDSLKSFSKAAPLNTDNHPRVTYEAPHFSYRKQTTPYGRMLALLELRSGAGPNLREDSPEDRAFRERLKQYLRARDLYLSGLVLEVEGNLPGAIDAYVASAQASEEFTTGYAHSLTIASVFARSEPEKARELLHRLIEAQPARPVARDMLQRLEEEGQ
jgi:spermidine synthase